MHPPAGLPTALIKRVQKQLPIEDGLHGLDYSLRQGRTELPLLQDLTLELLLDIPFFRELKPTSPVPRLRSDKPVAKNC